MYEFLIPFWQKTESQKLVTAQKHDKSIIYIEYRLCLLNVLNIKNIVPKL